MKKTLAIGLLIALAACNRPPEPQHPEVRQEGPFPNLSSVPQRPQTMPLAEREKLKRELMGNNKQAQPDE